MNSDPSHKMSSVEGEADSFSVGLPESVSDPTPFRSLSFVLAHLLFSSFLLLSIFWTFSTYTILDAMRIRDASSAHLLIVFDRPPPKKEASGLQVTLEKIVGAGNVSPMPIQSGQGPTERRTRQRVLSVLLVPGKAPDGTPVSLSEMVRSISQVVHNDARIQDIVYSPDWISRVDSLMSLSLQLRKGLLLVLFLAAFSLSLYWGVLGAPLVARLGHLSRSGEGAEAFPRTGTFRSDPSRPEIESTPRRRTPPSFFQRVFSSVLMGGTSSLIVLLFAWSLKNVLFPEPFSPLTALPLPIPFGGRLWLLLIMGSLLGGLGGGVIAAPFSSRPQSHGDSSR